MNPRILLACQDRDLEGALREELSGPCYGFEVETCSLPEEPISTLPEGYTSAIICPGGPGDGLHDLARFHRKTPDLPIFLVSSSQEPGFQGRALEAGAAAVVPWARDRAAVAEYLGHVLRMHEATRTLGTRLSRARSLQRDLQALLGEKQGHLRTSAEFVRGPRRSRLLPLLIADDPEDAFRLVRAFDRADIFAPLPILRSGEEAMGYLDGRSAYANRTHYPLPNIVLLDLKVQETSARAVVGWIRSQSRFHRMPVIVLGDAAHPEAIRQANALEANSYLFKPATFEELVEMVRAIDHYWSSINFAQGL